MNLFEYIEAWAEQKKIERHTGQFMPSCLSSSKFNSKEGRLNTIYHDPRRKPSLPSPIDKHTQISSSYCSLARKYESGGEAILISNDSPRFEQAFLLIKEACICGDSMNAVSILGMCYEFGLGIETNYYFAESAYVLASEKGNHPIAQSRLAFLRKYGRPGIPIDKHEAEIWINKLASHGPTSALSWFNKAAENGLPSALYCLGICYHDGLGCPKEEARAFNLYQQSAEKGFSRAYGILGYCYGEGFGVERNFKKSISYYEMAIASGTSCPDTVALFNLGCCYEDGTKGVGQDLAKAAFYYKLAAEAGNAYAQSALGYFYEYGIGGLTVNLQTAAALYRLSAEQGYPWAQSNLGYCYQQGIGVPQESTLAVWWYSKAAAQGHPRSLQNLGHCYQCGIGVKKDFEKAFRYFEQSASLGHVFAFHSLGHCYQYGVGTVADPSKAFSWYLKASQAEHGPAQLALAWCYKNGIGCERNIESALSLFEKAAHNGVALAQNFLGSFFELGMYPATFPRSPIVAVEWYRKAAEQGLPYALCNLAFCYETGNGIEQNDHEAFRLYEEAALKEHSRAMDRLALCYLEGRGTPADAELAVLWFKRSAEAGYAPGMLHYGEALEEGCGTEISIPEALQWYQMSASKGRREAIDKLRCLLLKLSRGKSGDISLFGHTACAA